MLEIPRQALTFRLRRLVSTKVQKKRKSIIDHLVITEQRLTSNKYTKKKQYIIIESGKVVLSKYMLIKCFSSFGIAKLLTNKIMQVRKPWGDVTPGRTLSKQKARKSRSAKSQGIKEPSFSNLNEFMCTKVAIKVYRAS